jgi:hypothetical protein
MSLKKMLFACFSSEMLCLPELRNALHRETELEEMAVKTQEKKDFLVLPSFW